MASTKRKFEESLSETLYSNKSRAKPAVEGRIDPTYGQRSALPGLDEDFSFEGNDDDLDYHDAMDAISYLRSVRLVLLQAVIPTAENYFA